eukprot:NODE_22_length_42145_cov_1.310612.p18 type:complete len:304 gc:universal NODE_22_length_42145_cov_1.310612:36013-36924(+)
MSSFSVRVPCSSANIGPGFDSLGIALSLYLNVLCAVEESEVFEMEITKVSEGLSKNPDENLLTQMVEKILNQYNRKLKKEIHLIIESEIPLGAGLGSSSTAVIAGVMIANEIGDLNLNRDALLDLCCSIEGHPDNVCPAFLGNFTVSVYAKPCIYLTIPFPDKIKILAATPSYQLATEKARQALPQTYSREDVVFNIQRASALPHILNNPSLWHRLKDVLQDKIHQPYRLTLLPGFEKILNMSIDGCLGSFVSGAGPTALVFYIHNGPLIENYIKECFAAFGYDTTIRQLKVDNGGALLNKRR